MTGTKRTEAGVAFGRVLAHLRAAVGVSQEELAHRADVDRTFISRLERGVRQPTITTLIAVGEALGTTATELVQATEKELQSNNKKRRSSSD